jgi:hypothetical protein
MMKEKNTYNKIRIMVTSVGKDESYKSGRGTGAL